MYVNTCSIDVCTIPSQCKPSVRQADLPKNLLPHTPEVETSQHILTATAMILPSARFS